jgi:hypothetical protein
LPEYEKRFFAARSEKDRVNLFAIPIFYMAVILEDKNGGDNVRQRIKTAIKTAE